MPGTSDCHIKMTLCPECVQHVRFCAAHDEISCPFCQTTFSPAQTEGTRPTAGLVPMMLRRGRLAASFVGATVLVAGSFGCPAVAEYGPAYPDDHYESDAGDDAGDVEDAGGDSGDDADDGDTDA